MFTRPLFCERSLVRGANLSELDAAVSSKNGDISIVFSTFVLLDRVMS